MFLPSFFWLVYVKLFAGPGFVPDEVAANDATAFGVIGVAALFLGLVLQGLRASLERLLSGYHVMALGASSRRRWLRRLGDMVRAVVRWKALREYRRLAALAAPEGPRRPEEDDAPYAARRLAEFHLDRRFPDGLVKVMPTKFGNRIRAWEDHARRRWSLESVAIEPHIESLLSQQELDARRDAETDVAFAMNACLLGVAAAVALGIDRSIERPESAWFTFVCAGALAASLGLYDLAVLAAERWGELARAGIDLHRADFYEKLAVRKPATIAEDRLVGPAVNRMLLYGDVLPDEVRAAADAPAPPPPSLPGVGIAAFWGRLDLLPRLDPDA